MKHFYFSIIIALSVFLLASCGTESTPIYTLNTSVNGEGTITPSGGEFEAGQVVTITSSPTNGWLLESWSGDVTGTSNTVSITMDSDKNVIGNFQRRDYPLTVTVEGEGTVQERVVSQPKTTDYPYETIVELTPNPSEGWRFVEWGGDLSGSESPIQITVDQEKNITVKFSPIVFLGENGVTIMCPDGQVGDIGVVGGVEYEVVDRELLNQRIEEGKGSLNRRVCVSLVTDMNGLFNGLGFNGTIGDWDVSNVTSMMGMFKNTQFNQPIGDWDVSNVWTMGGMFESSEFDQPIGEWDVSNVTEMSWMFDGSQFNQSIGEWDVSNVKYMNRMFGWSQFNQPIGEWDVSSVRYMESMFRVSVFNQPIGEWDVSNVTEMSWMFEGAQFNQNISNWCVWRIGTEPTGFSLWSPLIDENKPIWGTCPD